MKNIALLVSTIFLISCVSSKQNVKKVGCNLNNIDGDKCNIEQNQSYKNTLDEIENTSELEMQESSSYTEDVKSKQNKPKVSSGSAARKKQVKPTNKQKVGNALNTKKNQVAPVEIESEAKQASVVQEKKSISGEPAEVSAPIENKPKYEYCNPIMESMGKC